MATRSDNVFEVNIFFTVIKLQKYLCGWLVLIRIQVSKL